MVCVALDTETPARRRGSLSPVVQGGPWLIPLSPATWWSTLWNCRVLSGSLRPAPISVLSHPRVSPHTRNKPQP